METLMVQFQPFTEFSAYWMALSMAPVGIVPALIGLGATIFSAIQNRRGKGTSQAQDKLARSQAGIASQRAARETALFNQAAPAIGGISNQLQALLSGNREALTKQFAPQLGQLAGARGQAEQRIRASGVPSGGQEQAIAELEKSNFAERSRLLSSAPAEATAGLTQLLTLLLGGAAQQGQGATQAASVAAGGFESILADEGRNRLLDQQFFNDLSVGAEDFGASLFQPKNGGGDSGVFRLGFNGETSSPGSAPAAIQSSQSAGNNQLLEQLLKGLNT